MTKSDLEERLLRDMQLEGLPVPERNHKFHPSRKWELDFAWPHQLVIYHPDPGLKIGTLGVAETRLAVEIQGAVWARKGAKRCPVCREMPAGAHGRGAGLERDAEKLNAAQLLGWTVLQFTSRMVEDGRALRTLCRAFGRKPPATLRSAALGPDYDDITK